MRTFKRLILLLLLLAVAGLIASQWWVRSAAGVSSIERRIKASTGLEAEVGAVRLGWNLDFLITDLTLILKDAEADDHVLLEAPAVSFSGRCHRRMIRVSRPIIKAVQSRRGEWAPSQLKDFAGRDEAFNALLSASASVKRAFEITDAVLVMQGADGGEIVSFSGINWYHAPARLKGRPDLMHNVFSLQCIDGAQVTMASEWLSDRQGTYFLSVSDALLAATLPAEVSEPSDLPDVESVHVEETDVSVEQAVEIPVTPEEKIATE